VWLHLVLLRSKKGGEAEATPQLVSDSVGHLRRLAPDGTVMRCSVLADR
jgi:hypothetical protein